MFQTVRPVQPNQSGDSGHRDPQTLRIVIVAEHASMQFGGEAALPLHYFRTLRQLGIETWLVVHERTRKELLAQFPDNHNRIHFVPDTVWHRRLYSISQYMPKKLFEVTFGFMMKMLTELYQRPILKQLVDHHQIDVIHQPIWVSPKMPSLIFGLGVPVVIGPMNGGMTYPPRLKHLENQFVALVVKGGRYLSNLLNWLIPGKILADTLLVANQRTYRALPAGVRGKIVELAENGVDTSIWRPRLPAAQRAKTQFVFLGRLVDWKAVDWLLLAFKQVCEQVPAELKIIGDGPMRAELEQLGTALGVLDCQPADASQPAVQFLGWLSPAQSSQHLQQADALVLPSLCEAGGAVVLEAMAVGLPVIATNWGGPADYLDQSCGILIEPTSEEQFIKQLALAMIKLARSPLLREQMGKSGQQRVSQHYDWEKKVDTILEIYAETVSRAAQKQQS